MNDLASALGVILMALAPVIRAVLQQMNQQRTVQTYTAPRNGAPYPLSNGQGEIIARILKLEQADASFGSLPTELQALNRRLLMVEESAVEDRRLLNRYMESTAKTLDEITMMLKAIKRATGEVAKVNVPPEGSAAA